ncbi:MAG: hypothetical protein JOZ51_06500 [Chloroflexi bacterium]|nr:hypothetical protein [Chloroflexota bacterium]
MGHSICAILLKGAFDEQRAAAYDLFGIALDHDLTMFHIDHYYTACWQKQLELTGSLPAPGACAIFPDEAVIAVLVSTITGSPDPLFAVILTDYFGGAGDQWAYVYRGAALVNPQIRTINQALARLGVVAGPGKDEFDTIGLGHYRSQPEYLDKYEDLADELGV